ncbi:MAG TPA: glycosyltransferase [Burkholderiaceae bacterium]|nr:glycosyltransferase [Burkholderiaceae bacterium]
MRACPSYRWMGGLPHSDTRLHLARSHALVHPSAMEGGANAVVEAIRSRVPVLASRIDGNVGLLGEDYKGYFPVDDDEALAELMCRFADDGAPRRRKEGGILLSSHAAQEMRAGPSKPAYRRRLQTIHCCCA